MGRPNGMQTTHMQKISFPTFSHQPWHHELKTTTDYRQRPWTGNEDPHGVLGNQESGGAKQPGSQEQQWKKPREQGNFREQGKTMKKSREQEAEDSKYGATQKIFREQGNSKK